MLHYITYTVFLLLVSAISTLGEKDIFSMDGREFERLCDKLLSRMGYRTSWTGGRFTGRHQIDIRASRGLIFRKDFAVECKNTIKQIDIKEMRNLYAKMIDTEAKGIFITSGSFTRSAREYADEKKIETIDGTRLRMLCAQHGVIEPMSGTFAKKLVKYFLVTLPFFWFFFLK